MAHRPIEDAWLPRNHLFALAYTEGLVFLSVDDKEDTKFKPFEQLEDISSSSNLSNGFQRLNDANGDDVLFVDSSTDKFVVIHAGIGHRPSFIRRYVRFPENKGILRSIPNLQTVSVSAGDNREFIEGKDSPYENPTDAGEIVIPPDQHLTFDFFNPDSDDHFPILNIKMRKYKVTPLDPRGRSDEKQAISRILKPGSTIPRFTVGMFGDKAEFNLEDEWGVTPMSPQAARQAVSQR